MPPIVVIGVGNMLLGDDGVGLVLLERLERSGPASGDVEFVDGGTQGLSLLGVLDGRQAALILDAVGLGDPPGTVHVLSAPDLSRARRAQSAHAGNVGELLATAALLGQLPEQVIVLGIEPAVVRTGIGMSSDVESALALAVEQARNCLDAMRRSVAEAVHA